MRRHRPHRRQQRGARRQHNHPHRDGARIAKQAGNVWRDGGANHQPGARRHENQRRQFRRLVEKVLDESRRDHRDHRDNRATKRQLTNGGQQPTILPNEVAGLYYADVDAPNLAHFLRLEQDIILVARLAIHLHTRPRDRENQPHTDDVERGDDDEERLTRGEFHPDARRRRHGTSESTPASAGRE